ncbi:hypothetical protein EGR_01626 [Echinococcus granulosus]|uniref:Uncharacterized protein n=1 Tax=Echinococcus granulosus TaxID=6210 RepID=W6VA02_ECHGR|nr:hypothetical protein EGR_01626 [Echinococcus granulosus]EUB63544.1 hypothetical protein EGR_01626 [Echinococcus granulosus]
MQWLSIKPAFILKNNGPLQCTNYVRNAKKSVMACNNKCNTLGAVCSFTIYLISTLFLKLGNCFEFTNEIEMSSLSKRVDNCKKYFKAASFLFLFKHEACFRKGISGSQDMEGCEGEED